MGLLHLQLVARKGARELVRHHLHGCLESHHLTISTWRSSLPDLMTYMIGLRPMQAFMKGYQAALKGGAREGEGHAWHTKL